MSVRWIAESREDGEIVGRVGRDGDRLVAEWPGQARLVARERGEDPIFEPAEDAAPREVEKIRRGPAKLLVHHASGGISLHGAAVAIDHGAIVLLGGSEHGKSTTAAGLCDPRIGGRLLGDDAVAIERAANAQRAAYDVLALEEVCWLDAASARAIGPLREHGAGAAKDKTPFEVTSASGARASLVAIVDLAFVDRGATRLVPAGGVEAAAALLPQLVRFVLDDPDVARRDLAAVADLVAATPVYVLERERRFDRLGESLALLADLARSFPAFPAGERQAP